MVVSRWFVIPMAAISETAAPIFKRASDATLAWEDQISRGSCSTHPGWGNIWVNSFCAIDFILPVWSNNIALELVVPWSKARMYFFMSQLRMVDGLWLIVYGSPFTIHY